MSKSKRIFMLAGSGIIAVLGLLVIYGYGTASDSVFAYGVQRFLPAIKVGSKSVSVAELREFSKFVKQYEPNTDESYISERLAAKAISKVLASSLGLNWDASLLSEASFIKGEGESFFRYVVEPQVVANALKMYYNAEQIDFASYQKAERILDDVLNGGSFEEIAKRESDDTRSGQLGGDLGFFEVDEIIPELSARVQEGPLGEVQKKLLVSRYGYHVVYPVETAEKDGTKFWHAKHILIQTKGFEDWLETQTTGIKVKYLKN